MRRSNQSRPARYVNGVRLSDEEDAKHHTTQSQKKIKVKSENEDFERPLQLCNQFRMQHPNEAFGKQQQLCNQELHG